MQCIMSSQESKCHSSGWFNDILWLPGASLLFRGGYLGARAKALRGCRIVFVVSGAFSNIIKDSKLAKRCLI